LASYLGLDCTPSSTSISANPVGRSYQSRRPIRCTAIFDHLRRRSDRITMPSTATMSRLWRFSDIRAFQQSGAMRALRTATASRPPVRWPDQAMCGDGDIAGTSVPRSRKPSNEPM
jgi:hypothetical protein